MRGHRYSDPLPVERTHQGGAIRLDSRHVGNALVVRPVGELTPAGHTELRDSLLRCATRERSALVVDLDGLRVGADMSPAVLTGVWVRTDWTSAPILSAVARGGLHGLIETSDIHWLVPPYRTVGAALDALRNIPPRPRRHLPLTGEPDSGRWIRRSVEQACREWGVPEITPGATQVACELTENLLRHARSDGWLRLELRNHLSDRALTIAVADSDPRPPRLRPPHERKRGGRGLVLVDGLSRAWGHVSRGARGKVVWAVLPVPVR